MIPGEQRPAIGQAEMVRRVPRGRDGDELMAIDRDTLAIAKHAVGGIAEIETGIGARPDTRQRERRAADDRRSGGGLERRRGGAVVAVGVGADDRHQPPSADRREDRSDMAG